MQMSNQQLKDFLISAKRNGYANKEVIKSESLRPQSEDYHFKDGDLIYHDTYFGARDFIGEEIVYEKKRPIWGVNYYGFLLKEDASEKEVYTFLRSALMQDAEGMIPVRGPQEYLNGENSYKNRVNGRIERFDGAEEIFMHGNVVYRGFYHGGFIS